MFRRSHDPHIKSLLHFQFPYYGEPGYALNDDIGIFSWSRAGNSKIASLVEPGDIVLSSPNYNVDTFGFQSLHTESNSDYITGTGATLSLSQLQVSFWFHVNSSAAGNLLVLKNGDTTVLSLTMDASGKLKVSCSPLNVNLFSSNALSADTWDYVRVQISKTKVTLYNFPNGTASTDSAYLSLSSLSALPQFNTIQLGGINGELHEFVLRDSFTDETALFEPIQGTLNLNSVGGFGTGSLGNVTLSSNCKMNTTGIFYGGSGSTIEPLITFVDVGKFGGFKVGDEVMLVHLQSTSSAGYRDYCFRTITSITTKQNGMGSMWGDDYLVELDSPPVWPRTNTQLYAYTQCIAVQIPNFNNLTINSGVTVSPAAYDEYWTRYLYRGFIAFRCKGDCTINGSLITLGSGNSDPMVSGPSSGPNSRAFYMSHSKVPDYLPYGVSGLTFITCGGTLTLATGSRIGAPWGGSSSGGVGYVGINNGGGCGYGGGASHSYGAGLLGWGGYYEYEAEGKKNLGCPPSRNGTFGTGSATTYSSATMNKIAHPYPGANIFIVANKFKGHVGSLSTGGENAPSVTGVTAPDSSTQVAGAGAGYCYVACNETLDW